MFKNLKKKNKLAKGVRWDGGGGAGRWVSEPTQTDARFEKLISETKNDSNSEDGSGGL